MASRLLPLVFIALGLASAPVLAQPSSQTSPAPIALEIGKVAVLPDIQLMDGRVWKQSEAVGKVVIIEIWHTRCPFCAKQNPLLNAFYLKHRHRGLDVIAVSTDKSRDDVQAYLKKNGYAFDVAMADPVWMSTYKARRGLPQVFVLDRRSVVRAIELREMFPDDVEELIRFL
jgi:thiol-disulfide isomerase/thioredoxin